MKILVILLTIGIIALLVILGFVCWLLCDIANTLFTILGIKKK